jgi:hypothetical protein
VRTTNDPDAPPAIDVHATVARGFVLLVLVPQPPVPERDQLDALRIGQGGAVAELRVDPLQPQLFETI